MEASNNANTNSDSDQAKEQRFKKYDSTRKRKAQESWSFGRPWLKISKSDDGEMMYCTTCGEASRLFSDCQDTVFYMYKSVLKFVRLFVKK